VDLGNRVSRVGVIEVLLHSSIGRTHVRFLYSEAHFLRVSAAKDGIHFSNLNRFLLGCDGSAIVRGFDIDGEIETPVFVDILNADSSPKSSSLQGVLFQEGSSL
jgi:hypothetical protein